MNFDKIDLINNGTMLIITNENGGKECIDESIATDEQKAIIAEFKKKYPEGKPKVVDLDMLKAIKIKEISDACNKTITTEFFSDVDGTLKNYDFELENQVNMAEMAGELKDAKRDGLDITNYPVSYYAKGESCHNYTAEQFLTLTAQGKAFKLANVQQYKDNLKLKAEACTTEEELNDIVWIPLPSMAFIEAYKIALAQAAAAAAGNTNTSTPTTDNTTNSTGGTTNTETAGASTDSSNTNTTSETTTPKEGATTDTNTETNSGTGSTGETTNPPIDIITPSEETVTSTNTSGDTITPDTKEPTGETVSAS